MARKTFCDRCGKECDESTEITWTSSKRFVRENRTVVAAVGLSRRDLCTTCVGTLLFFFEAKVAEEP